MKTQGHPRQMLIDLGVAPTLATMAIPYVWFLPGAVDPDAQGVIEIVKAVQRGLRKLGHRVMVSGVLDKPTAQALDLLVPPKGSWPQTAWIVIMEKLFSAARNPQRAALQLQGTAGLGLGDYPSYGYGPLPGRMVGLPPGPLGWMGMGDSATDQGVSLTFGQGIKTPSNVVPVPKDSGPTFEAFRHLQRQVNRLLSKLPGGGSIGEDAIIGESTRKALERLVAGIPFGIKIPVGNTVTIAKNAVTWGQILKGSADSQGVSTSANKGSSSTPARSFEPPTTALPEEQVLNLSQAGFFGFLDKIPGGKFIPFIALGLGAAWFVAQQRKKSSSSIKRSL